MTTRRRVLKTITGATALMAAPGTGFAQSTLSAKAAGYRLPEEAGPHLRTFMQWPVNRSVYSDPVFLQMVQRSVADIANAIVDFEPVVMLMAEQYERRARRLLGSAVEIWDIATDDLWCRDAGPIFVRNDAGELAITQVNFNGWGNKQVHESDGKIASKIARRLGFRMFDNGLVGEGGGVEFDGFGTLMAHESSWVNPNRNSGSRQQIGDLLLAALGGDKIIWAPGIIGADITDYHIDALARFVTPGVVLIQMPDRIDRNDQWSVSAFETYEILKNSTDANGRPLRLVVIPEPYDTRVTSPDFVAAYVNYYVCNGAVILAQFGDREADAEAARIIGELHPGREIITLNVDAIGEVGGGVHCTTQQQPA